jgi:hypothetical protein
MNTANTNTSEYENAQISDANEYAQASPETGTQLRERLRVKERTFQAMWKRTFGYSFRANETCSMFEVATMEAKYPQKTGIKKEQLKRVKAGKVPVSNEVPEQPSLNLKAAGSGNVALLWGCLVLSLACSVPNMYGIAMAMKGNYILAILVTAAFTVAPFLLIGYGIKGWLRYAAYIPIGVEIFCNSAGFFGGMTGLSHSLYIEPTVFLHMVTSMTNSANEPTAFILSVSMAVCIAILAIVPVHEIEKRRK